MMLKVIYERNERKTWNEPEPGGCGGIEWMILRRGEEEDDRPVRDVPYCWG